MKITRITSHVLQHDMPETLGYSQQYYTQRTAHLVEVETDAGVTGWGECFGPGNVAVANKGIVEQVIQPMVLGLDPMDRDVIWHKVYNLLRDHGQKGMPMQALSGVDIALWDIAGKVANLPLHKMIGGAHRVDVPCYGYGMMLRDEPVADLAARFTDEAAAIKDAGFAATKMKVGFGPKDDVTLCEAVRRGVGDDFRFMVDANHAYTTSDAFYVGRALEELDAYWFEEPIAPEDLDGAILENRGLDIAQPEVCALGGISEYLRVLTLCHAHFTPVINHVWGSAIAVATNLQLLGAMPPLPGGLHPWEPMLEFDTTTKPGIGVEPDRDFLNHYRMAA